MERGMSNAVETIRDDLPNRDKLVLAGLYLSKFDEIGLKQLGFDSFLEAYNVIGYGLGSKPASIKNYRDEFDPLFPNSRKGWHKRATREYCLKVFKEYHSLTFEAFTVLVRSFFDQDQRQARTIRSIDDDGEIESSFAQRLITGLAAEHYFESIHSKLPEFQGYVIENTTRLGCGYDYKLRPHTHGKDFLAVEVKGLKERTGNLSMTPKEHDVAALLRERFFLFVVRNFREVPSHDIFPNPLAGRLTFNKVERITIQVSWQANV